jgi:hypothetical protein
MPGPDDDPSASPSPSALGNVEGQGWIVHGQNDYVDGSSKVCSDEDLLTNPAPEFFGLYLEQGPGMPDDWNPDDMYQVNADGILLSFDIGEYDAYRFDGNDSTGIGTGWETAGTFTFDRDAQGVITGGHGTGKTRIVHESGDIERLSDTMSFTVVVAPEPPWCDIAVEE